MPERIRDDVPRLLRQIRLLLLLTLFAVVILILMLALPDHRDAIFMVGALVFLIVLAIWAFTSGVDSVLKANEGKT